jgi:hypothetical protein
MEICKGMYSLLQVGIIANKLLKKHLAKHGYYAQPHTPGFFCHQQCPIWFNLTMVDFGIKYIGEDTLQHLLYNALHAQCIEHVFGDHLNIFKLFSVPYYLCLFNQGVKV